MGGNSKKILSTKYLSAFDDFTHSKIEVLSIELGIRFPKSHIIKEKTFTRENSGIPQCTILQETMFKAANIDFR
jgi:hypothetical protein